jgi:hypothetical protein
MYEARAGESRSHKNLWIRSLLRAGLEPVMEVDVVVPDGEDWKRVECERVAFYRAKGADLTNGTAGGDEPLPLSEDGRRRLAKTASARFGTPEARVKQSAMMKALCRNDEWRAARDAAAKATRSTPEYKARMSARSKAAWSNPETRAKFSRSRALLNADPEFRLRLSEAVSRAQSDPAYRAMSAERTRLSWAHADHRARRLAAMRGERDGKDK